MKKYRPVIIAFTLLSLLFIWTNSILPSGASSKASSFFTRIAAPFLEIIVGKGNVTEHLIRKLAHFSEFAFYGLWLTLWVKVDEKKARIALLAGFVTAFLDETIQIFSGRGPSITDVWIDVAGIITGMGFIHLIFVLSANYSKKKK